MNDTSCSTCWLRRLVEHRDRLQRRQRHLVGARVAERHVAQLDLGRARGGSRSASGFSSIIGGRSSTSKTRSKLTSAVITSTCTLDSAVSGPYSRPSSAVSATSVPSGDACRRWRARRRRRRPARSPARRPGSGGEEDPAVHRLLDADVAHPAGPVGERARTRRGSRPNSLTSSAPETLNRSVIVVPISALSCIASRVIACSRRPTQRAGQQEQRQQHQRAEGDLPGQVEHRRQRPGPGR